jgi:hypothetical protein
MEEKMKQFVYGIILVLVVTGILYADEFKTQEPILISSAGQSADVLMAKVLAKKAALNYTLDKTATEDKLKGNKSLILVCGGSTKGLGAAKIDKEQELERVKNLIKAAKNQNISVIALHIGGKSRRGGLSDYFNIPVAEDADFLIVVKTGNEDGMFSKIAKEKDIPLELPEKIVNVTEILKSIYAKEL